MDFETIKQSLSRLSELELEELRKILNPKALTITQIICENPQIPIRLWSALRIYSEKHPYATEINRHQFLSVRNVGANTWNELEKLLLKKYKIQI